MFVFQDLVLEGFGFGNSLIFRYILFFLVSSCIFFNHVHAVSNLVIVVYSFDGISRLIFDSSMPKKLKVLM